MSLAFGSAISAYKDAVQAGVSGAGMAPRETAKPGAFAGLMQDMMQDAVSAGQKGEAATQAAMAGKADLADVVSAVNNAEIALQTVVAVRDRVISAYQEILRMPI